MRTNIVLDDGLVEQAQQLTGIRTKRELVDRALRALIREHRRLDLLELYGKIELAEDYDYKALREDGR